MLHLTQQAKQEDLNVNKRELAKELVILTVAVAIIAAAVFFFLIPNQTGKSVFFLDNTKDQQYDCKCQACKSANNANYEWI